MVVAWKHVPILFTFEQLVEGGIAINIKAIIFFALMKFCGLFEN
jgi:hypothetical protein